MNLVSFWLCRMVNTTPVTRPAPASPAAVHFTTERAFDPDGWSGADARKSGLELALGAGASTGSGEAAAAVSLARSNHHPLVLAAHDGDRPLRRDVAGRAQLDVHLTGADPDGFGQRQLADLTPVDQHLGALGITQHLDAPQMRLDRAHRLVECRSVLGHPGVVGCVNGFADVPLGILPPSQRLLGQPQLPGRPGRVHQLIGLLKFALGGFVVVSPAQLDAVPDQLLGFGPRIGGRARTRKSAEQKRKR